MLKMRSVFKRSLAAIGCGTLFLAAGVQAQITPFTKDVGASIDKGLVWQDANGAYTGSAGQAIGLSLLALLEKRVDSTNPGSPTQGYALASATDKARMDSAVSYILTSIAPQGYFYAYGDGASLMALSVYLLTGGPNPGFVAGPPGGPPANPGAVGAAINTIFDRVIANQRVGYPASGAPWTENNGYWCYYDGSCRDSSTTQLVMAGLASVKGVYISGTFGDAARLASLNTATARARTAYKTNGTPGNNNPSAGCSVSDPAEKGHAYNAEFYYNTLQQTGSGTWIQLVGGADVNDADVQKYLKWLLNRYNYTGSGSNFDYYPGYSYSYYYYLWSTSKAFEFIASGAPITPGNIGPANFGLLAPAGPPACDSRQLHRNPLTDTRVPMFGAGGAGFYAVELPRVYYDMAYTLLSYQCANGDYHCGGVADWDYYAGNAYALLVLQRSLGGGCIDVNKNGVCDAVEEVCDVDGNGQVDTKDLSLISRSRPQLVLFVGDPRDGNGDGKISPLDVAACMKKCTNAKCAP